MKDEAFEIFKESMLKRANYKPFLNLTEIGKLTGHCYDYARAMMYYRRGRKIGRQWQYPIGEVILAAYEDCTDFS